MYIYIPRASDQPAVHDSKVYAELLPKVYPKVYPDRLGKGQGLFRTFSGPDRTVHVCCYLLILFIVVGTY